MNYIVPPTEYPVPMVKVAPDMPDFPLPKGFDDANSYLNYLVLQGAERLYGQPIPEIVMDRLHYESDVISKKGFAKYFLIINDMVCTARERFNIYIGPGRGSSSGSLVCYCLGITKVDPLKHDLLFECFISADSDALPDIDVDYESGSMEILVNYLKEKYGETNVSRIIVYCKSREKCITGYGVDSCGIALSKHPITCYSPLAKVDDKAVTIYDRYNIEDVGPVKIDILEWGDLNNMHKIIDRIQNNKKIRIDINSIAIDDASTLNAFANGDTDGIPNFSFEKFKLYLKHLSCEIHQSPTFDDLCAFSVIIRRSFNDFREYYLRRRGDWDIECPLPIMVECTKQTYGMILYQEQVMTLTHQIAGFSRSESDDFIKTFRNEDKLCSLHQKFIDGGESNGYSKDMLENAWSIMLVKVKRNIL